MSGLFRRISRTLKWLGRGSQVPVEISAPPQTRSVTRFVCSVPVLWEAGRETGDAVLREVSATGMRLRLNRVLLVGKNLRVRPAPTDKSTPLSSDVAIGSVVYCRALGGGFEVGIELINPERISRYAWIGQLLRQRKGPVSLLDPHPESGGKLTLVKNIPLSGGSEGPRHTQNIPLLKVEKKIQKSKDTW